MNTSIHSPLPAGFGPTTPQATTFSTQSVPPSPQPTLLSQPPFQQQSQQSSGYLSRLRSEFFGYTPDQLRLLDTRGAVISSTNFLPTVPHQSARTDSLGRHLYRALYLLLNQLHPMFLLAIEQNIHFGPMREEIANKRASIVASMDALQLQADEYQVPPPDSGLQAAQRTVRLADKELELQQLYPSPRTSKQKLLVAQHFRDLDLELSRSFVSLNDKYHTSLEAVRRAQARIPSLRLEREAYAAMESVLEHFSNYSRSIALRLYNAVSVPGDPHLKSIAAVLMTRAHLFNEEVPDPLSMFHLPGLLHLLALHYNNDTLSSYFEAVIDVFNFHMSPDEAIHDPETAMTRLVYSHNDWSTRGLFQSLSQDILFACLTIKGIPPDAPLRLRLITATTQYMRSLQDGTNRPNSQSPVFDFVLFTIRQYAEDVRLSEHPGLSLPP
jgi:hypothetical protein